MKRMVIKNYQLVRILKKLFRILLLVLFANIFIFMIIFSLSLYNSKNEIKKAPEKINTTAKKIEQKSEVIEKLPTKTSIESEKPIAVVTSKVVVLPEDNEPWGVAKQIDDVTWTMKVGEDERMGTPQEVFEALNNYRQQYGRGKLVWDQNLANFAQERANFFDLAKSTDKHAGFKACMEKEECSSKLGRDYLGENSAYGYKLYGVHLIEWIFAGDEPHNSNQLNTRWIYAGVGVKGLGVDIIFGT